MTPTKLPAILTPMLAAAPEAAPAREILPFPVAVETVPAPPVRLIPWEAVVLAPPVPLSVMLSPAFVLILPPVRKIPWQAPVVPAALAVMEMGCDAPVVEKFTPEEKPTPPFPRPVIAVVAVTVPVVVKAAATLIPFPPVVALLPPTQLEKVTLPLPVKAAPKLIPWQAVPEPPLQLLKVMSPVVPLTQV